MTESASLDKVSASLDGLTKRAKQVEANAAAARSETKTKVDARIAEARDKIEAANKAAAAKVAAGKDDVSKHMAAAQASRQSRWDGMKERMEQRRADRKADKAAKHADHAIADAEWSIDMALESIGDAEYAVLNAIALAIDAAEEADGA